MYVYIYIYIYIRHRAPGHECGVIVPAEGPIVPRINDQRCQRWLFIYLIKGRQTCESPRPDSPLMSLEPLFRLPTSTSTCASYCKPQNSPKSLQNLPKTPPKSLLQSLCFRSATFTLNFRNKTVQYRIAQELRKSIPSHYLQGGIGFGIYTLRNKSAQNCIKFSSKFYAKLHPK